MRFFSREQQIERYAKELSFWKTEIKLISNEQTRKNLMKKHIIETMEITLLSNIMMSFDDEMNFLINKKCEEIMNV